MRTVNSISLDLQEAWTRKVETIPSVFARLIYLSQLRDNTGRYRNAEILELTSQANAHRLIRESHINAFRNWLTLTFREQTADLRRYLCSLGRPTNELLSSRAWTQLCTEVIRVRDMKVEIRRRHGPPSRFRSVH